MRQRGPQIGAPFKVPSYLIHLLVVPSIRFHTLVSNAHDAPLFCSVTLALPRFALSLWCSLASLCHFGTPSLRSVTSDAPSLCSVTFHSMVPSNWKMSWYPHANKLLQKWVIFDEAINLHSRGPMEQHLYIWEPHHGCLHKVKKVSWCPLIKEGQRSHNIGKCPGTPMLSNCSKNV